jgi:hypothetical protein
MPRKTSGDEMSLKREKEAQSGLESSEILETLKSMANPERTAGMNKYGTNIERAPEISMLWLRQKAIKLGKNHSLALELERQESIRPESLSAWLKIDLHFLMLRNF